MQLLWEIVWRFLKKFRSELSYDPAISLLGISPDKTIIQGVPIVAQWVTNLTSVHEDTGSIPGLAQWIKDLALL